MPPARGGGGRSRARAWTNDANDGNDATTRECATRRSMRRTRDSGRGDGSTRRKKARWFNRGGGPAIAALGRDARGVIVTCDGGKERAAARDVCRNLTERWEAMKASRGGAEVETTAGDGREAGETTKEALERELSALRDEAKKAPFREVSLDLRACTFVLASKEVTDAFDVADIVREELMRAKTSGEARTRHALRMVPVDATCFAGVDEIAEAAKPFVEKHFAGDKEQTFAIAFDRRANGDVRRNDVIECLASQIKQPPNKVNLSDPDLTFLVEIVKGVACLSVVRDYEKLLKYNVRMASMNEEERAHAREANHGNAPRPPRAKERAEEEKGEDDAAREEA